MSGRELELESQALTQVIVEAGLRIHRRYGPGLLESVYGELLFNALVRAGLQVERQKPVPFTFEGIHFDRGFTVDLLVEDEVVIELKSVEQLASVHTKQLLTYLRLLDLRVGLLMNFGAATMKEGLKRVLNGYTSPSCLRPPVPPCEILSPVLGSPPVPRVDTAP